jgi:hypothetical protein
VERHAGVAFEPPPDERLSRARDVDREAVARQILDYPEDMPRYAAVERLGCNQDPGR